MVPGCRALRLCIASLLLVAPYGARKRPQSFGVAARGRRRSVDRKGLRRRTELPPNGLNRFWGDPRNQSRETPARPYDSISFGSFRLASKSFGSPRPPSDECIRIYPAASLALVAPTLAPGSAVELVSTSVAGGASGEFAAPRADE